MSLNFDIMQRSETSFLTAQRSEILVTAMERVGPDCTLSAAVPMASPRTWDALDQF
jgi:hypothetical protein